MVNGKDLKEKVAYNKKINENKLKSEKRSHTSH